MGHDRNQSRSQERSKLNDHPHDQNQPRRPRNNHLPNGITSECERRSSRSKLIVLHRNSSPSESKFLLWSSDFVCVSFPYLVTAFSHVCKPVIEHLVNRICLHALLWIVTLSVTMIPVPNTIWDCQYHFSRFHGKPLPKYRLTCPFNVWY